MAPETDATIIGRMRLILSGAALIVYVVDLPGPVLSHRLVIATLAAYFVYSLASCLLNLVKPASFVDGRFSHWLDVAWYTVFLALTEPIGTTLFLFFIFAILSASFRYGYVEGRNVTLASAGIYIAISSIAEILFIPYFEWSRPLLRGAFLLVLGYMIARWGESELLSKCKLTLLREVSRLSNPRFGVERTIASVLEKICHFFHAETCVLVQHDVEADAWLLREIECCSGDGRECGSVRSSALPKESADALLAFGDDDIVALLPRRMPRPLSDGTAAVHFCDFRTGACKRRASEAAGTAADLLEAGGFFSAPLPGKQHGGRIYVTFSDHGRRPADAAFLAQVASQAFTTIDSIDVLDRLATAAAYEERRKIGRDLHDSTIQPYIGLKLGLEALQRQAPPDNPLAPAITRLVALTGDVIRDLQGHVARIRIAGQSPQTLLAASIERQVARFREFYGIDITVRAMPAQELNDRLAAEVVHIVNEGLSNIRKHTLANHGAVTVAAQDGLLQVR
ncbi:MAG: sensor histidine kinase, partial [Burkholderiaceae bacterium]